MATRPLYSASDVTGSRVIGTPVTNGVRIRTVNVAVTLIAGSTTTTATYSTVIAGIHQTCEFGRATVSGPSGAIVNQFCSFLVDARAAYSISVALGVGSSSATIRSWLEVDMG
jgi:hypothetical protein